MKCSKAMTIVTPKAIASMAPIRSLDLDMASPSAVVRSYPFARFSWRRISQILAVVLALAVAAPAFSLPTFRSAGTRATGTGSLSAGAPGTCSDGDLWVMFTAVKAGSSETISTPSGWTQIHTNTDNRIFGRIRQSGDAVPSVDWSATGLSYAQVACFSNMQTDLSTITTGTPGTNGSSTASDFPYSGTTPAVDNAVCLIGGRRHKTVVMDGQTINAETGFTEIDEFSASGTSSYFVWNYQIQTTATAISAGVWDFSGVQEVANTRSLTVCMKSGVVAPSLSSVSVTAHDITSYTVSYTPSQSTTVYLVAYKSTLSAPTCTQIKAAQDSGGAAALGSANEAVTGADSTAVTISATPRRPIHNLALCANDAGGDSSVSTITNSALDPPAGFADITLTSITSLCTAYNAAQAPDIATSDIVRYPTTTTPGGYTFSISAACLPDYNGGADTSRQIAVSTWYDASVGSYGTPDLGFVANNQDPACDPTVVVGPYKKSQAIAAEDWTGYCPDAEGDTLTFAITSGSDSTGVTLASNGGRTGTPSVESESGDAFTVTVTDTYGGTGTIAATSIVYDTVTVPTCINVAAADFENTLDALYIPWAVTGSAFSATIAAGNIIACSPAATNQIDPVTYSGHDAESVSITLSLGIAGSGTKRPQIRIGIGIP